MERHGLAGPGAAWRGEVWRLWRGSAWQGANWTGLAVLLKTKQKGKRKMISHLNKAQDLELDMIDKKGTLTPAAVVARARSGESALHKLFVWDDSKAADLHRLETARSIIRLRTVVVEHVHDVKKIVMRSPTKHDTETTRKYVCLNETKKDGNTQYHRLDSVLSDAKKRELLLMQAYQELLSFRKKYLVLSELAQVFAAIDAIKKTA